ncbi:hypothetical protein ACQKNB_09330 [Lysinibacillus xylanilyticus]|uniref:hypothetical protein n=1 Tax=Lysinibacillus xylanilyticus TaxID=582475 RepID=UPI003D0852BE
MSNNKIASSNIALTFLLILSIAYNYFYDQLPIQIEFLGNLGFWLVFPLSLIIIVLSLKLIKNKASNVSPYITFIIAVAILIISLYSLFHWGSP